MSEVGVFILVNGNYVVAECDMSQEPWVLIKPRILKAEPNVNTENEPTGGVTLNLHQVCIEYEKDELPIKRSALVGSYKPSELLKNFYNKSIADEALKKLGVKSAPQKKSNPNIKNDNSNKDGRNYGSLN